MLARNKIIGIVFAIVLIFMSANVYGYEIEDVNYPFRVFVNQYLNKRAITNYNVVSNTSRLYVVKHGETTYSFWNQKYYRIDVFSNNIQVCVIDFDYKNFK